MAGTKIESGRGFGAFDTGSISLSNSTTETTLFSETIKAGKMGTNKIVEYELLGAITTLLVAPNLTVRVYLGASVLTIINATTLALSQTGTPFIIKGKLIAMGATNSQYIYCEVNQAASSVPMLLSNSMVGANWTVDTTTDQLFKITAQFGSTITTTSIQTKLGSLLLS